MATRIIRSQQLSANSTLITDDGKEWKVVQVNSSDKFITALFSDGQHADFLRDVKLSIR